MQLIADTHVHFYPGYEPECFWAAAAANLERGIRQAGLSGPVVRALYLTERHDCHAFADWRDSGAFEGTDQPWCLQKTQPDDSLLHVVAGRQIATAERLEVHALCTTARFEDGLSLAESIQAVQESGGVVVLPWAPGKWLGERGKKIAAAAAADRNGIRLADSSTRPRGWPEPGQLKAHRQAGGLVFAGSDPYPYAGQETMPGQFGSLWQNLPAADSPALACRSALDQPPVQVIGSRKNLVSWALSMWRCSKSTG